MAKGNKHASPKSSDHFLAKVTVRYALSAIKVVKIRNTKPTAEKLEEKLLHLAMRHWGKSCPC